MATHDYIIANGTGAAVRSDLNDALAAIVSNNSSATAPATTYAYMWWADTTTGLLKLRNSANSAWISLRELDGTLTIEDGTAAAPGLAFTSDLNTGLFRVGADQVAITTGGTSRLAVSTTAVSSTLAVDVPLGAVGTPSLTFTGDLNTGLFSPGADTLALVTGGTNRVHVTSGGLVGLGTSGPGAPLHVESTSAGIVELLRLKANYSTTNVQGSAIELQGFYQHARISSQGNPQSTVGGDLRFQTYNTSTGTLGTGMILTAAGLVGIGTTSPTASLVCNGHIQIINTTPPSSGAGLELSYGQINASRTSQQSYNRTGSAYLGADYDALDYRWYISGSLKATIDTSGRLLVGTIASPAHQLQVSTDSAGKPSTNTWTIVSDQRIKEDIELANLDLCYEAIKNIPLKRFKWRDEVYTDEQVRDRRKLGWIAQDVEAVFPKAVGTYEFKYNQVFEETIIPAVEEKLDADGNVITPAQPERIEKGELISEDVIEDCRDLNADQLYAAMYGAVQKLIAKVETLEASNAALLARLSVLESA